MHVFAGVRVWMSLFGLCSDVSWGREEGKEKIERRARERELHNKEADK